MKVDITWRPNVEQTAITTSATSQQSAAFATSTTAIRLAALASTATYGVHFSVGSSPVATANSPMIPAGGVEYIQVQAGEKVALLQEGGALKVTITELTH
ncbi:MAG: hypothetical protein KGH65_03820 [Candidatus Micrarchaeota archaeon]|nr:hypothetical protein [Candidatus Micrarchaeota archaeon]